MLSAIPSADLRLMTPTSLAGVIKQPLVEGQIVGVQRRDGVANNLMPIGVSLEVGQGDREDAVGDGPAVEPVGGQREQRRNRSPGEQGPPPSPTLPAGNGMITLIAV